MDQETQPTTPQPQQPKQRNKKIIGIIIGIIAVIALIFAYLEGTKPSPSEALAGARTTKIDAMRGNIVMKSNGETTEAAYAYTNNVIHAQLKGKQDNNSTPSEIWMTKDKVYFKLNDKWYYTTNLKDFGLDFNDFLTQIKKEMNLSELFSKNLGVFLQVKLDGLKGYILNYNGGDSKAVDNIMKEYGNIKNLDYNIYLNRQKKLRSLDISMTMQGTQSIKIQIQDVNNVNDLNVPANVKKEAVEGMDALNGDE